jgi:hypothetical protein
VQQKTAAAASLIPLAFAFMRAGHFADNPDLPRQRYIHRQLCIIFETGIGNGAIQLHFGFTKITHPANDIHLGAIACNVELLVGAILRPFAAKEIRAWLRHDSPEPLDSSSRNMSCFSLLPSRGTSICVNLNCIFQRPGWIGK